MYLVLFARFIWLIPKHVSLGCVGAKSRATLFLQKCLDQIRSLPLVSQSFNSYNQLITYGDLFFSGEI